MIPIPIFYPLQYLPQSTELTIFYNNQVLHISLCLSNAEFSSSLTQVQNYDYLQKEAHQIN